MLCPARQFNLLSPDSDHLPRPCFFLSLVVALADKKDNNKASKYQDESSEKVSMDNNERSVRQDRERAEGRDRDLGCQPWHLGEWAKV
jgi:hypothetical protein